MKCARAVWIGSSSNTAARSIPLPNPMAGNDNSKGAAYNEKADKRSWEAMKQFFAEIFK